jgi:4-hydroxy-tetrahydrodipicolinate reductase
MSDLRLIVVGAAGRMGQTVIRTMAATPGVKLAAAIERPGSNLLGKDASVAAGLPASGVVFTDDPLAAFLHADAVIDFTVPAASVHYAELAAQARIVHVIGTTGCSAADEAAFAAAARHARVVRSGNMSLGVNLVAGLVRRAAAALGEGFDIEIVEMHHRKKVDAPSGTALLLGEAAAAGRGVALEAKAVRGRDGITGERKAGDIGFASLRGGTVIGDHTVTFAGEFERIEIGHRAEDRSIFARGALTAAKWAFDKKPGLYSMADVLGLD